MTSYSLAEIDLSGEDVANTATALGATVVDRSTKPLLSICTCGIPPVQNRQVVD